MTRLGLVFAGQGAQHPGMGAQLYASSPAARKIYDQADAILGWPLSRLCFEGPQEELTACAHCQPAIYTTSLAAWSARQEAGLGEEQPAIAGGLSLGELAALTAAGAQMILFTTGRGTPLGGPAPTLKVSTNSALAQKKAGWIDFNAGSLLEGASMADAARTMAL